jgi:23S rRNA (cytosine1962-C5)-methyltransferase
VEIQLKRNLRKSIKRGHPWVYKDSISLKEKTNETSSFASLKDNKGLITQGIYDSTSPIAFRALDFNPLKKNELLKEIEKASKKRASLKNFKTTGFRLINGEGDGFSGLICDVYNQTAVIQFDGSGMEDFWTKTEVSNLLLEKIEDLKTVVFKPRGGGDLKLLSGDELESVNALFLENGLKFKVNLKLGQKTGFFFDQRDNRNYVKDSVGGKTLLNAFSYTGGFSVYAGASGKDKVVSLDLSPGAIEDAGENWLLNDLDPSKHEGVSADAFEFLESNTSTFDCVIVDPPSMSSSQKKKQRAVAKYTELFATAAKVVKPGGDLILSSCSSQISFEDFNEIVIEALSNAHKKGKILRFSGQGLDHPYPHFCPELRYLKFMHISLS